MTVADVRDHYQRRDALKAAGGEEPCTGCDKELEPGEEYSTYALSEPARAPRGLPDGINLCRKCTFLVMGSKLT
jgi:hypothetical protein